MKRKKSALLTAVLVDYDNIYLALKRKSDEAAKRFAKDSSLWLREIESGRLITPTNSTPTDVARRIVLNRCYGNPVPRRNTHDNSTDMSSFPFVRHHFLRSGFEIVDCPPLTAQQKNASDIRMVMDVRDFLQHETYFDEFVILSGDADFTPVMHRLRAHARRTVIFANDHTAAPYTAISDGEVREQDLITLLLEGRIGAGENAQIAAPQPDLDLIRGEIINEVVAAVGASGQPIPLEALADRAVRLLGHEKTAGTAWAGAGSFRELLSQSLPQQMRLSDQPPYVVIDMQRMIARPAPAPAAIAAPAAQVPAPAPAPVPAPAPALTAAPAPIQAQPPQRAVPPPPAAAAHPQSLPSGQAQATAAQAAPLGSGFAFGANIDWPADSRTAAFQPVAAPPQRTEIADRRAPAASSGARPLPHQQPLPSFADTLSGQPPAPPAPQPMTDAPYAARPSASPVPAFSGNAHDGGQAQHPTAQHSTAQNSTAQRERGQPSPGVRPSEAATALQQSIARIHEACQAPPLSPPEYRMLFELSAKEITERGLAGAQTITNITQRAQELGLDVRRDDVRFVLEVVSETDPWFEQGASANIFAGRFRNFVVARCRSQGLNLSADELDLIEAWFVSGASPQPASRPAQQPQAAPDYAEQGHHGDAGGEDDFPRFVRNRLRG